MQPKIFESLKVISLMHTHLSSYRNWPTPNKYFSYWARGSLNGSHFLGSMVNKFKWRNILMVTFNIPYSPLVILAIYLKSELNSSESSSTTIFHVFAGFMSLCPIFGAILADQYLGKFKSILWMSVINIIGLLIMTLATIQYFTLPQK